MFDCAVYVYLASGHPLAGKESISFSDLEPYPCLSFEQGNKNSFYFAEEVLSNLEYKQTIKADDRATMLNLMTGLNGYTLCSGIICEELNGDGYTAVPFAAEETKNMPYSKCRFRKIGQVEPLDKLIFVKNTALTLWELRKTESWSSLSPPI